MIDLSAYRGRRVAVLGLGRSGLPTARALLAGGADLLAWDDGESGRRTAADAGIPLTDLMLADWAGIELLVLSPGIPHDHPRPHPVVLRARAAGCAIVCDVELLYQAQPHARFVGITGTNGKSTTTALITHILSSAGLKAVSGGNIGTAALSLEPLGADGIYVLELSSYQLELIPTVAFDVAVLLNISPDHLDRHGGLHPYAAAKCRVFARGDALGIAVVGTDDRYARHIAGEVVAAGRKLVPIASTRPAAGGVSAQGGILRDEADDRPRDVCDLRGIPTLPGAHNWQNAAAAYAVASAFGVRAETIAAALPTYPGLPHRQEPVATIGPVRYVNDSKATNADSAARALGSYDTVYWIAGGLPKEGGIAGLAALFDRIRCAFLVGTAADAFAETLDGHAPWRKVGDLESAVTQAHVLAQSEARPDGVVLLSPACASFDQWPNFEARGDAFRAQVRNIAAAGERAA